jgi:hypothetical protein
MERRWLFVGGTGLLLIGYFLGQSAGPTVVRFPDPGQARDAQEMERAVGEALKEPLAFPRSSALIRLFEGLSIENVEGASRAISARAGRWDPVDLQLFLAAWAQLDPASAVRTVERWPIKSRRHIGLKIAVREWAASGRAIEAVTYVQSIQDPLMQAMASGPLVRGWALGGDTAGAVALAHRLWTRGEKLDVVDGLIRGVLQVQGPEGALELMSSIDPMGPGAGGFEHRLASVTLNLVGRENPQAAAAAYAELVTDGRPAWLEGSLNRLAGLWRNEDPQGSLEWVLVQEPSPERSKALKETLGTWANRDFDAAWAWFETNRSPLPEAGGLFSDNASLLTGLVRRMARDQPPEAARWAIRLPEGPDRTASIRRIAHFWAREDARKARSWLEGLGLPQSQLVELRAVVERGASIDADEEAELVQSRKARTGEDAGQANSAEP